MGPGSQSTGIAYARCFIRDDPCPREVLGTSFQRYGLTYPPTFFYIVRQVRVAFLQTVATRQLLNKIDTSLRPAECQRRRLTSKPLPTAFRVSLVLVFGVPVDLR